jgi:hypothetical protein
MVEDMPRKLKALNSNPNTAKKIKVSSSEYTLATSYSCIGFVCGFLKEFVLCDTKICVVSI